jgi:hypothetical protein
MEPSGSNVTGRFFCFATPLAREEFAREEFAREEFASELFILHKDEKNSK